MRRLAREVVVVRARHPYPHHFTASGIVLHNDHVLLVFHKRLQAWVPPGGHVEAHEVPEETCRREILEETGLAVDVVSVDMGCGPESGQAAESEASFLTQPAYIQCVTAREKGGDFYHIDLAYACLPSGRQTQAGEMPPLRTNKEVEDVRWVPLSALDKLPLAKNVAEGVSRTREALSLVLARRAGPAPEEEIPAKI